jgi:hypothetical protein
MNAPVSNSTFQSPDNSPLGGGSNKVSQAVLLIAQAFNQVSTQINMLINTLSTVAIADGTTNFAVPDSDNGATYLVGHDVLTITLADPANYTSSLFNISVKNNGPHRINVNATGFPGIFFVYPGQDCRIKRQGPQWVVYGASGSFVNRALRRWEIQNSNWYVDPVSGADNDFTNDGITSASAFATLSNCYQHIIKDVDCLHTTVQINLTGVTHLVGTGFVITYPLFGSSLLVIQGVPGSTFINCDAGGNCLFVREEGTTVSVDGVGFTTSGFGSTAISVSQGAVLDISNFNFGNFAGGAHIAVTEFAAVNLTGDGSITGSMTVHFNCTDSSYMTYGPYTINIPSPLTFTEFAAVTTTANVNENGGSVFTGAGAGAGSTGQQYVVTTNAVFQGSHTTWPGATPGSTSLGGLFV